MSADDWIEQFAEQTATLMCVTMPPNFGEETPMEKLTTSALLCLERWTGLTLIDPRKP